MNLLKRGARVKLKRFSSVVIVTLMVFVASCMMEEGSVAGALRSYADTTGAVAILIDGQPVEFTLASGYPYVDENSRTQVPFRATMETFGAEVSWVAETNTAIAIKGGITLEVPIGQTYILKNGEKILTDTEARIIEGRTYLPIRAVLKAFDAYVNWNSGLKQVEVTTNPLNNPIVTIEMATGEKMLIMLYPSVAPNTVLNFITLVENKFYDGVIFHRVIKGFMIQGGDPLGNGSGNPGYQIAGEFSANGFENSLSHTAGVLAMARSANYDSAGSQFFIVHQDSAYLDGNYATFGKVVEGYDLVDKLASVPTNSKDKPISDLIMTKVTVETFGVDYPEPTIMK